jgi:hypothetical protein
LPSPVLFLSSGAHRHGIGEQHIRTCSALTPLLPRVWLVTAVAAWRRGWRPTRVTTRGAARCTCTVPNFSDAVTALAVVPAVTPSDRGWVLVAAALLPRCWQGQGEAERPFPQQAAGAIDRAAAAGPGPSRESGPAGNSGPSRGKTQILLNRSLPADSTDADPLICVHCRSQLQTGVGTPGSSTTVQQYDRTDMRKVPLDLSVVCRFPLLVPAAGGGAAGRPAPHRPSPPRH